MKMKAESMGSAFFVFFMLLKICVFDQMTGQTE